MANPVRYRKPSMTNIPFDLGQEIFAQILSSPLPNRKKMAEESNKLLVSMLASREREIAVNRE